jgi:hypothetical protein
MDDFNKDLPIGSHKLRLGDDEIRANMTALEDAIGRNHKFPTGAGTDAGEHEVIDLRNQTGDPETPTGKLKVYSKTVGGKIVPFYKDPDGNIRRFEGFPSGTKLGGFYQDTAPPGWTIQDTLNDKLVYITKGSAAGGQIGGTVHDYGSWTISGISCAAHTHTMEDHKHELPRDGWGSQGGQVSGRLAVTTSPGAGGDNISAFMYGGAGQTLATAPDVTSNAAWRPATYCCIVCQKD